MEEGDGGWRLKMKWVEVEDEVWWWGFINKNEEDARIVPMVWPFKERVFLSFHVILTEKSN